METLQARYPSPMLLRQPEDVSEWMDLEDLGYDDNMLVSNIYGEYRIVCDGNVVAKEPHRRICRYGKEYTKCSR